MATATTSNRKTGRKKDEKVVFGVDVRKAAKAVQTGQKAEGGGRRAGKEVASAPVNGGEPNEGKVSRRRAGSKFHVDQPTLPTDDMKKVAERVKPLDDACQRVLSIEAKINELRTEHREQNELIGNLLKENDLGSYIINGEQFFKKPSGERVVHQKMKLNG